MTPIDPAGMVRGAKDRVSAVLSADKTAGELVELVRDMHRIMSKLEEVADRFDEAAKGVQEQFDRQRLERIEQAILNIERATGGVEAAMNALPKALRSRIFPEKAT